MAFKPKSAGNGGKSFEGSGNFPTPRPGPRKARVSLIIDLGTQQRPDFEDPNTKEMKPQKPCQQVLVFADLVNDNVDYGGSIGKAQYRLPLFKQFKGDIQPINFTAVPPRDPQGNMIEGKEWGFHPANLLTKLSRAVGKEEVITSMDIEQLLDMPFIAEVEVKETPAKGDKKDKDGKPVVYKNVNFKGATKVPTIETDDLDDDGNPIEVADKVAELKQPARLITFDGATKEDIKFIRANILKLIKLAEDYAGSQMQKAIEEYEAENGGPSEEKEAAPAPAKKPIAKAAEDDEDSPF